MTSNLITTAKIQLFNKAKFFSLKYWLTYFAEVGISETVRTQGIWILNNGANISVAIRNLKVIGYFNMKTNL